MSLPLDDTGFDHTVLSEFRGRLVDGETAHVLLDRLVDRLRDRGLLRARARQRTDSTHVLAAVRALSRLELVRETMRHALDTLAELAAEWLHPRAQSAWVARYHGRSDEFRLPAGQETRRTLAEAIGADGSELLAAVYAPDAPSWLRHIPAVQILRRVWLQNYVTRSDELRWRTDEDGIPKTARFVSSPVDADVRLGRKRATAWVGYKGHSTETCDDDTPNVITHVATTPACIADGAVTPWIHRDLDAQNLLPQIHLVDTGYLDSELLVVSRRDYAVELLGPTRRGRRWRERAAKGFGVDQFAIDWERRLATCPEGHHSVEWRPRVDARGNAGVYVRFSLADCRACPSRAACVDSSATYPRRSIAIRPRLEYEALQERRAFEESSDYAVEFTRRAGIESTISQGVRRCGLRRSRYVGLPKTHLGHVATAAALNFVRMAEWLAEIPRAPTRRSRFTVLMAPS